MRIEFRSQGSLTLKENDVVNPASLVLAISYRTRQTRGIFSFILGIERVLIELQSAHIFAFPR